jgi:hypothetical protein
VRPWHKTRPIGPTIETRAKARVGNRTARAPTSNRALGAAPIVVPSPVQDRNSGRHPERARLSAVRRPRVDRDRLRHPPVYRIGS